MKEILILVLAFIFLFTLHGCKPEKKSTGSEKIIQAEANDEYFNKSNELMLKFQLNTLKIQNREEGNVVIINYTLFNNLKELSVTKVDLTIEYMDENEKVINQSKIERLYRQTPIEAGTKREVSYVLKLEECSKVKSIRVNIDYVATQLEIAPFAPPITDSYLFDFYNNEEMNNFCKNFYINTPIKMEYFRANIQQSEVDDPEIIKEVFEALKKVKIGKESNIHVTDSEIHFTFIMPNEERVTVAFDSKNILCYNGKIYKVLENGGVFDIEIPVNQE